MLSLKLPNWRPCAISLTLPFHQNYPLMICTTGELWGLLKITCLLQKGGKNPTETQKGTRKTHKTKKPKLDQAEQSCR